MSAVVYDTREWAAARARTLERDGSVCSLSRLFGGECHPVLDVHHLTPVAEGGDPYADDNLVTVCHRHHPMLDGLRRWVTRQRRPWSCPHQHRYAHAREACERRHRHATS